jgi:secreted trypsin-like serine protease
MTNSPPPFEIGLRPAAREPRTGCANCAQSPEENLRQVVENLSRKYTQLADVVTRYMSEAGLERGTRTANAVDLTAELLRITGGHPTSAGSYPDCVLIGRRATNGTQRWFCSGALVHPRVVLTAGHCQSPAAGINLVALDALDIQGLENAQVIGVRRVRVNPRYPQVIGNDIAVLVLREDSTVPPVPIATTEEVAAARQTTLVGFGNSDLLSTKGFGVQREVTVDITNLRRTAADDLDAAEQALGFESDREFTAGGGGFDSCNGDSGGPAYIDVDGVRKLAGLTSRATEGFTTPCGDGGIYTRVDTQRAFIDQVLSEVDITL